MFSVLTVVVFIAVASGTLLTYEDDVLKKMYYADEGNPVFAKLVNYEGELTFWKDEVRSNKDAIYLSTDSVTFPVATKEDIYCALDFGIVVGRENDEVTYCKIQYFGIEISEFKENTIVQFVLRFEPSGARTMALEIPILKAPAEFKSEDSLTELKSWATSNSFGVLSFAELKNLGKVREAEFLGVDFNWLGSLLELGIYKSETPRVMEDPEANIETYVTHPVVIPEDALVEFTNDQSSKSQSTGILSMLGSYLLYK